MLLAAIKAMNWHGLDIVVCPASGDETFDLEEKLRATLKVQRDSDGMLAWAEMTFDARGFESPGFADRTINRLRRSFEDGAVAVKIWKNIGMAIKSKSGLPPPDEPTLLPIYDMIQRADRTLITHLAEPIGAWLPLDAGNPEFTYYSINPQWHIYGKVSAREGRHP